MWSCWKKKKVAECRWVAAQYRNCARLEFLVIFGPQQTMLTRTHKGETGMCLMCSRGKGWGGAEEGVHTSREGRKRNVGSGSWMARFRDEHSKRVSPSLFLSLSLSKSAPLFFSCWRNARWRQKREGRGRTIGRGFDRTRASTVPDSHPSLTLR